MEIWKELELAESFVSGSVGYLIDLLGPEEGLIAFDWDGLEEALQALPLDTDEYLVSFNDLRNARSYVATAEWGAARFTLQLLSRRLTKIRQRLGW